MHDLDALDPAHVADVLSRPPFVHIPGVINSRDLGLYPSVIFPGKITKPKHLYRSTEISRISPEGPSTGKTSHCSIQLIILLGKELFKELNITKVFDLRSDTEIRKYNAPPPKIDGVEIIHVPVFETADYSPETMAK